jgi:hypothetical protein
MPILGFFCALVHCGCVAKRPLACLFRDVLFGVFLRTARFIGNAVMPFIGFPVALSFRVCWGGMQIILGDDSLLSD